MEMRMFLNSKMALKYWTRLANMPGVENNRPYLVRKTHLPTLRVLLKLQGNTCAICQTTFPWINATWITVTRRALFAD
jgi:hypothetical protein